MRRWYEPRKDTPGIAKDAPKKKGFARYFEILWREFFPLLKLNLLFIISCLPIVTIPAALTAMNRITVTMVRDRNYFMLSDYWDAFKRDFFRSLLAGVLVLVLVLLLASLLAKYRTHPRLNAAFYGLRPASTALIGAAGVAVVLEVLTGICLVDRGVFNALGLSGGSILNWKGLLLAALVICLTNFCKKTKGWHPIVFIALSAAVGVAFGFAG